MQYTVLQPGCAVQVCAGLEGPVLSSGVYIGLNNQNDTSTAVHTLFDYGE